MNANDIVNVVIRVEKMTRYYKTVEMSRRVYESLNAGLNGDSDVLVAAENIILKIVDSPDNIEHENIFINDFMV